MIVAYRDLKQYRKKVAMVDGAFDPLHHGHIEYFRKARETAQPLLCNIAPDSYIHLKHPPLLAAARRAEVIDSALRLETAGLRQEMRDGFAAVRQEMRDEFASVRQEMYGGFAAVRQEMRDGFAVLRHEMAMRHADQLKWSFLFWVGQVAVVAGLFGVLLRVMT